MNEKILLSGDVDAIKEYVFETSYLPQIRGGSQLLINCEESVEKLIDESGGNKIYCGGGSFLFWVPHEKAESLKKTINRIYMENTGAATITVAIEREFVTLRDPSPLTGWALRLWQASDVKGDPGGGFAFRASLIGANLREEKTQKKTAPFHEALPFAKRCDCCGKRMASEEILRSPLGEIREVLRACKICHMKHQTGGKTADKIRGKFNQDFSDFMKSRDQQITASQASDLENLTQGMKRTHLAFIYADGNEIGCLLKKNGRDEKEYQTISRGLTEGTKKALFEALFKVCGPTLSDHDKKNYWPFEIVTIGGDDIMVLIQACFAWELAVEFLDNFEKYVKELIKQDVTASCGIAIADVKYPVRYLRVLAEGSLKRAKKKAKEDSQKSAIDFIWLPNPVLSESVEELTRYYNHKNISLIARPYSLEEAKTINRLVERAIDLPSSQRHLWGEALERGVSTSRNVIFYNIARMKEDKRNEFKDFLKDVTDLAAPQGWKEPIWVERNDGETKKHYTALLDVLELAELRAMRKDKERKEENA